MTEETTGGDAFEWGEVSEEVQEHVDGKTPLEAVTALLETSNKHRNSATQREESLREQFLSDDDFLAKVAEKGNLIQKPDNLVNFIKDSITDETKYDPPDGVDPESAVFKVLVENAKKSGILPEQMAAFVADSNAAIQEQQGGDENFEKLDGRLKDNWGENYDANQSFVDDYLKSVGGEKAESFQRVLSYLPIELQEDGANYFAYRGKSLAEGLPGYKSGGGSGSGGDPEADWKAVRQKAKEAGGAEKLSDADKKDFQDKFEAYKAHKDGKK